MNAEPCSNDLAHADLTPLVLRAVRRRPGRDGARRAAGRAMPRRADRPGRSARAQAAALHAARPSTSSSCSRPARPATSTCSTTSRSWQSSTAQLPPAELLKGYRAAFINPQLDVPGARSSSSPSTASRGAELSELLPHLAKVVDDIAIVTLAGHRRVQSRARPDHDEHRLAAVRPAEHRRLDDLRPGERVAAICRASSCFNSAKKGTSGGVVELGLRLSAHRLPGRAVPQPGRSGAVPLQSAGHRRRRRSATRSTRSARLNEHAARRGGRPGDRHADQLLRAGLPDADAARRS